MISHRQNDRTFREKNETGKSLTFVVSLTISAVLLGLLPTVARFLDDGTTEDGFLLLAVFGPLLAVPFFLFCIIAAAIYGYQNKFLRCLFCVLIPIMTVLLAYLGLTHRLLPQEYALRFRLFLEQTKVDELLTTARGKYGAKKSTPVFLLWKSAGLAVSSVTETYLIHVQDANYEASILGGEPITGIKIKDLNKPQQTFEPSKSLYRYNDCTSRTWKMHSGYYVRKHYCPH